MPTTINMLDIPPVLLNTWKHHAGFLRRQISHALTPATPLIHNRDDGVRFGP